VLATLALQAGQVVGTDRLVDAVWGNTVPATARNTLQSHVSYLRQVLRSKSVIISRAPGYLLDLGESGTDVQVAERLLRQGTQAADPADGVRLLQAAAGLWRGRPMSSVTGLAWLEQRADRLDLLWTRIMRASAWTSRCTRSDSRSSAWSSSPSRQDLPQTGKDVRPGPRISHRREPAGHGVAASPWLHPPFLRLDMSCV
jgi:two-component SAPR family response regulator